MDVDLLFDFILPVLGHRRFCVNSDSCLSGWEGFDVWTLSMKFLLSAKSFLPRVAMTFFERGHVSAFCHIACTVLANSFKTETCEVLAYLVLVLTKAKTSSFVGKLSPLKKKSFLSIVKEYWWDEKSYVVWLCLRYSFFYKNVSRIDILVAFKLHCTCSEQAALA